MRWILLVIVLSACGGVKNSEAQEHEKMSNEEFSQLLNETDDVQLIDVRTTEEVSFGMIQGAQHVNIYDTDFLNKMEALDTSKPVAVYCAAGGRSATACEKLKELGFQKVYDLEGGMRGWQAAGYPVEK